MDRGTCLFLTAPLPPWLAAALRRQGIEIVCPFNHVFSRDELRDFLAPLPGFFHLPRNMPVYVPLLAANLEKYRPAAAVHVSPEDPREFLAVYEDWRSRMGPDFRIHTLSVHPGQAGAEKLRQLKRLCADLGVDWKKNMELAAGEDNTDAWREWERTAWQSSRFPSMATYLHSLRLGLVGQAPGQDDGVPPAASAELMADREESEESIAIFGDWLLGDELFRFLSRSGRRVVLAQKAFDLLQGPMVPDTAAAWPHHFCFQPEEIKNLRYREEARSRKAGRALGVTATFSPRRLGAAPLLQTVGLPHLSIETEWPGFLTESDKIRLENFLSRPVPQI